ncbi:putative hydrolase [Daejeonella rubra]|uniref:Putative hydrolase n=1 Tax=Daejeonella rubra TaxID=990371 RepID=A0A1G9WXG0_9SPHI|nr:PHP domain-containing protein [Daejeonella rubra]SDM89119.1 putative hydrolase [Daejeonella rubra]
MKKSIDYPYLISAKELLENKVVPRCDFHIHTNYTDGKATVGQVFEKAIAFGLEAIAFTEHTEPWHNLNPEWFSEYCKEIRENREIYKDKIKAYIGIEAPAISFEGELGATKEMFDGAEFILGAAHRYPGIEGRKVSELKNNEAIDLEFKTLIGLATSPLINSIAHIGGTCSKYCTPFPTHLIREVVQLAVKNNVAIEVNPVYHMPLRNFIELCAEENANITLGSNAHGFNDIGLIVKRIGEEI